MTNSAHPPAETELYRRVVDETEELGNDDPVAIAYDMQRDYWTARVATRPYRARDRYVTGTGRSVVAALHDLERLVRAERVRQGVDPR